MPVLRIFLRLPAARRKRLVRPGHADRLVVDVSFDRCSEQFDKRPGLPPPLFEELLDRLVDQLGGNGPVLDLGAGTGRFAIPLQARGIRVVEVDISHAMLRRARMKGARDVCVANAMRLPFRDRTFETTLTVSILHLVASWRGALHEVARVTRNRLVNVSESSRLYRLPRKDGSEEPYDPLGRYLEIAGPPWREYTHPGHHWVDLAERIVPPKTRITIGPRRQVVDGDWLLSLIEARAYSPQWPVPDPVHAAALERLRIEMAIRQFEQISEVEIVSWTSDELRSM